MSSGVMPLLPFAGCGGVAEVLRQLRGLARQQATDLVEALGLDADGRTGGGERRHHAAVGSAHGGRDGDQPRLQLGVGHRPAPLAHGHQLDGQLGPTADGLRGPSCEPTLGEGRAVGQEDLAQRRAVQRNPLPHPVDVAHQVGGVDLRDLLDLVADHDRQVDRLAGRLADGLQCGAASAMSSSNGATEWAKRVTTGPGRSEPSSARRTRSLGSRLESSRDSVLFARPVRCRSSVKVRGRSDSRIVDEQGGGAIDRLGPGSGSHRTSRFAGPSVS